MLYHLTTRAKLVPTDGYDPSFFDYQSKVLATKLRGCKLVHLIGIDPISEDFQSSANPSQLQMLGVTNGYRSRSYTFTECGAAITL